MLSLFLYSFLCLYKLVKLTFNTEECNKNGLIYKKLFFFDYVQFYQNLFYYWHEGLLFRGVLHGQHRKLK